MSFLFTLFSWKTEIPLKRAMENLLFQDLQAGKNRLSKVSSNCHLKESHNYSFNSNIINNVNSYYKRTINSLFKNRKVSKKIKFTYNTVANLSTQTCPGRKPRKVTKRVIGVKINGKTFLLFAIYCQCWAVELSWRLSQVRNIHV